jgi:hypothetical protein
MIAPLAETARRISEKRKPVSSGNPFLAMQEAMSTQIVTFLDSWREIVEGLSEQAFLAIYGNPLLQAAVGIDPQNSAHPRAAPTSPLQKELLKQKIAEIKGRIALGGIQEAVIRGLLYAGMTYAAVDERGFELMRRLRIAHGGMSLPEFKSIVREQSNMLLVDQKRALEAIPSMLPANPQTREKAFEMIKQILSARGADLEDNQKLREVAALFLGPSQHEAPGLPH